jgi:hypothetical protein
MLGGGGKLNLGDSRRQDSTGACAAEGGRELLGGAPHFGGGPKWRNANPWGQARLQCREQPGLNLTGHPLAPPFLGLFPNLVDVLLDGRKLGVGGQLLARGIVPVQREGSVHRRRRSGRHGLRIAGLVPDRWALVVRNECRRQRICGHRMRSGVCEMGVDHSNGWNGQC